MGFERVRYPDGQIGAKIKVDPESMGLPLEIRERINSYEDLFYVRSIADVFHSIGERDNRWLFIPCLFGQRSDRRFERGQSFDLKLIAEVINACKFKRVKILDPHSDVALAIIDNSEKVSSFEYVKEAIKHYHDWNAAYYNYSEDPVLVSPDAGAYKKVFEYGKDLNLEVVAAVKHRDKEGKVDLTFMGNVKSRACFIIDDLCDGGYTFCVLADALRKAGAKEVYLYVTHGYFSKGFTDLHKAGITHIYCTNSVKDLDFEQVMLPWGTPTEKLEHIAQQQKLKDYVTQFKVI